MDAVRLSGPRGAVGDQCRNTDAVAHSFTATCVRQARQRLGELRERSMVVRREDRARARPANVRCGCSVTAHASARPSYVAVPQPISSNSTSERGGAAQDVRGLRHLDHERGLPRAQPVGGADAREQPVHEADHRARPRARTSPSARAATMKRELRRVCALSRPCWGREQPAGASTSRRSTEFGTYSPRAATARRPDVSVLDVQPVGILELGARPAVARGGLGERGLGVKPTERGGGRLQRGHVGTTLSRSSTDSSCSRAVYNSPRPALRSRAPSGPASRSARRS